MVLLVVMPVGVLMSMVPLAGLLGSLLGRKSDRDNTTEDGEPNEYLALAEANPYDD